MESGTEILFFLGAICNRKGVGLLGDVVRYISSTYPEFRVKLVGLTYNTYWDKYLEDLENSFPENFLWLKTRIAYGNEDWIQLRENVAFAIFPSFEEGLAGCAMDVINLGIPLIHSSKTGLEIAHPFLLNFDFENRDFQEALSRLIQGGESLWMEIYRAQKNAAFFQNSKNDSIIEAVRRSSSDNIWPGLSLEGFPASGDAFSKDVIDFWSANSHKYRLGFVDSVCPNLLINYITVSSISTLNKLRIAVFILEKYNNYNSVGFSLLNQPQEFVVERVESIEESPLRVSLYIPEYTNPFLREKRSLKALFFKEKLSDMFVLSSYWISRGTRILMLKIIFELSKRSSKFPSV